ncbi:LytTR family DNA-binding domain-containing protein [Vallitalea okinawensis]|uniref:LytTR family DNA-binding domain-containing protein n=1 Tax=Vallitalea okinawensis TaxID=2078660 RepID=UPI000CFB966E|nr:LytTR family DNA-binding domain-containing protein [Vallitalea okinawensis]
MKIHLSCSECVNEKLRKLMLQEGIQVDDNGQVALVEKGYEMPSHKVCILFEAIDFMEAFELVKLKHINDSQSNKDKQELKQIGDRLTAYNNNRYILINPQDILYINVNKTEVTCITKDKTCYLKEPLYYYEEELKHKNFIKINKSQLVNLMNVVEIIPWFNSRLVLLLDNDIKLEVSKMYAKLLRNVLGI